MHATKLWTTIALLLAATSVGCLPPQPATMPAQAWHPDDPTSASCGREELRDPRAGSWPDTQLSGLRAKLGGSEPAVVRAIGCKVEVLGQCQAPGAYHYTAVTPLSAHRKERVTTTTGRFGLDRGTVTLADLAGHCEGATHVVGGVLVGRERAQREHTTTAMRDGEESSAHWNELLDIELVPLSLGDFRLTGTWEGALRQPEGPLGGVFDALIDLEQRGSRVSGTSHLNTLDGTYWGILRFEGRLEGNILYFADVAVVDDNMGLFFEWCLKGGYLVIDPRTRRLTGPWRAGLCAPGTLELSPIADDSLSALTP